MSRRKPWKPEPEDVEVFTEGGCPWLAIALHEVSGWPLAMLIDEGHYEDWGGEELPGIAHVFVLTPWDTAIDIHGESKIKKLKERYHDLREPKVEYVSLEELKRLMGEDKPLEACPVEYVDGIRKLANRLIRAVGSCGER